VKAEGAGVGAAAGVAANDLSAMAYPAGEAFVRSSDGAKRSKEGYRGDSRMTSEDILDVCGTCHREWNGSGSQSWWRYGVITGVAQGMGGGGSPILYEYYQMVLSAPVILAFLQHSDTQETVQPSHRGASASPHRSS
jgi:hypothetical protein